MALNINLRRLNLLFQTGLGIDIQDNSVSIAYLKGSFKGVKLAAHAIHPLEKEGTVEEKLGIIAGLIRDFMGKNRITSTEIFLGIPRDKAILRYIELPLAVKENLRGTLRYEMEKYVPISAEDLYFDYQVLSEDKVRNRLKVLFIVVKKSFIDPYFDLRNRLDVGISGVEITSTAMANYFSCKPDTPNGNAYAFVYLRDDNLELNLVKERLLNYSKSVMVADSEGDLHSLILQELKPLRETLGQHGRVEAAFCGPDAGVELLNRLREEGDLDVRSVDLSGTTVPLCAMIPAYGLALKGVRKAPMDINLLPVELRKKPNKAGYYTMFVLTALIILSVIAWGGGNIVRQKLDLNQLNAEIKRLDGEIANIERIQTKCKKLEDRIDYLNAHRGGRLPTLNILKDLSLRIPEGAWVRTFAFSDKGVQIEGHADSASELISLLETSPLFKDVAFLSPITKSKDGKERFRIGLKFKQIPN
jgi:Tfp pilus assembly protein PilN